MIPPKPPRDVSRIGDTVRNPHTLSLLLSADSLAEALQISKRTLWRLRSAGKLPRPLHVGSNLRWRALEIQAWIEAGCPPLNVWDQMQTEE